MPARVRVGSALGQLGDLDAALSEGDLGFEHAEVLGEVLRNPRVAEQVIAGHGELVELARRVPFEIWRRTVGELVALWDSDGVLRSGSGAGPQPAAAAPGG